MNIRNLKSDQLLLRDPPNIESQMYGALIVLHQTAKLVSKLLRDPPNIDLQMYGALIVLRKNCVTADTSKMTGR